jgi:hypothetical protein
MFRRLGLCVGLKIFFQANGIAEFKANPTSLDPKIIPNETPKNERQEIAAASCKGSH